MTTVLVPYRPGCAHRERAWEYICGRHLDLGRRVITGASPDGLFNRAAAILDAARQSRARTLIIADADVWCDGIDEAVAAVEAGEPWAVPHQMVHRLSPESTIQVLHGDDWHGLPLSTDNPQDSRPYRGHETGTLFVIAAKVLHDVPPDVRFVGWGSEDDAWSRALRTLVGAPWRADHDLVHLWHPAQPRKNRRVGNDDSAALLRRYRDAFGNRRAMRSLVDESLFTAVA